MATGDRAASGLNDIVRAAVAVGDVQSAAIFTQHDIASPLVLAAAAGIEGPPLDALVAAVENPLHPIARAMGDAAPTFDVRPMNPGGPALRSHLPLGGRGVLAVAHDASLGAGDRAELERLAANATKLLAD